MSPAMNLLKKFQIKDYYMINDNFYREFYSSVLMESQSPIVDSGKHCVMVGLEDLIEDIKKLNALIPDDEIFDDDTKQYGRETWPHVTILYGILPVSENKTKTILKKIPSKLSVALGKNSLFENEQYDVLKIDVTSPQLVAINRFLRENVEYESEHPGYIPHLTIAYLKKGFGKKYINSSLLDGRQSTTKRYTYSNGMREKTHIDEDTSFAGTGALLGTYTAPAIVARVGSYNSLGNTMTSNPYNTLTDDDITIGDFNKDSVLCGMRYEMSKMVQPDKTVAKVTVRKNLEADPRYYDDLKQFLDTDAKATENPLK